MKKDFNFQEKARQQLLMLLSMRNITEEEFRECSTAKQFKELIERKKEEEKQRRKENDR